MLLLHIPSDSFYPLEVESAYLSTVLRKDKGAEFLFLVSWVGSCSGTSLQGFGVWVFLSKYSMASWTHGSSALVQSSIPFLVLKLWGECSVREYVTYSVSTCLVHYPKLMTLPRGRRREKVRQRKGLMERCILYWPKVSPSCLPWLLDGERSPERVALKCWVSVFPLKTIWVCVRVFVPWVCGPIHCLWEWLSTGGTKAGGVYSHHSFPGTVTTGDLFVALKILLGDLWFLDIAACGWIDPIYNERTRKGSLWWILSLTFMIHRW